MNTDMASAIKEHVDAVIKSKEPSFIKGDWLRIRRMIVNAYGEYFKQYIDSLSKYDGIGKKRWEVCLEILRSELHAFYGFDYYLLQEGFERTRKRIEAELLAEKRRREEEIEAKLRLQLDIAKRYDGLIAELQALREEAKQAGMEMPEYDEDPL